MKRRNENGYQKKGKKILFMKRKKFFRVKEKSKILCKRVEEEICL